MKIALFSDIHANLSALLAVWADMEKRNIDQVYCLGDLIGYAPFPNEVVEEIRKRRIPTIAGNHDEAIGYAPDNGTQSFQQKEGMNNGAIQKALTHQLISSENRAYLKGLPRHMRIDFGQGEEKVSLLLVHGSPRKINEYIFEAHPEEDLLGLMAENQAHIMAFGHTHKPFHKILNSPDGGFRHAINTGSVGKPKDANPQACYVLLELADSLTMTNPEALTVNFVRVPYDMERTALAIEQSPFPDAYADMLRKAY